MNYLYARRRELLSAKFQRLPLAYQEVKYIEFGKNQWLNTGVIASLDMGSELKISIPQEAIGSSVILSENVSWRFNQYVWQAWQRNLVVFNNQSGFIITEPIVPDNIYIIIRDAEHAYVNSVRYDVMLATKGAALMLFNNDGVGRCYNAKFYSVESGENKGDFVPCYRKFDNKPGMYDLVTKQFFTNAGPGEFTVGPNV